MRHNDTYNWFKHPRIRWLPLPGSHVLMERRKKPFLKEDLAVVLSVSPLDCSCLVKRDFDNKTLLLNWSKLVRDPAFTDNDVVIGGAASSMPGGGL